MQEFDSKGTKHVCDKCGCRFYGMGQDSLACPKCGAAVETSVGAIGARRRVISEKISVRAAAPAATGLVAKAPDAVGEVEALNEEAVEESRPGGDGGGTDEEEFAEVDGEGKETLGEDGDDGDAEENGDGDDDEENLDEEMMVDEEDGEGESEDNEDDDDDDDGDDDGTGGGTDDEEES